MLDDQETHYPVPGETPWVWLRYPVLTETGIRRTFAGIGYRFVPWAEVRDVMRVYQQTGSCGNPLTLMVTTTLGNVYRPDEKGYIPPAQRRAFFREWIAGKSFMINCSGKKSGPKIVAYVEKYYGPLDYDFVAEREKQHPTPKKWW